MEVDVDPLCFFVPCVGFGRVVGALFEHRRNIRDHVPLFHEAGQINLIDRGLTGKILAHGCTSLLKN
jgi:hypothetical protein